MGIGGKGRKDGLCPNLPKVIPSQIEHFQTATIASDYLSDDFCMLMGQFVVLEVHQLQKS
jgi:hypothetical protein